MIGQGRAELTSKFIELLRTGGSPERVDKLEGQIKELHGMEKFDRFRTQMLLVLIDAFQSGMYFALTEKAIENEWELVKILGFPTPKPPEHKAR